jgi:hypothetical protein
MAPKIPPPACSSDAKSAAGWASDSAAQLKAARIHGRGWHIRILPERTDREQRVRI